MKRKIGLLTTLVLVLICVFALADVEINEENFPDAAFRNVATKYDTDKDGMLSDAEIGEVIEIDCSEMGITTLQGIEYFSALENLRCYFNQLTSLDFSGNTALVLIECYSNQLTSLDISKNMALVAVNVSCNPLKSLDVSRNTALKTLYCFTDQLTVLDVSNNRKLENLLCGYNQLTSLDLSNNTELKVLSCESNPLTGLDLSKNTKLTDLECNNNGLTSLDVSRNTKLTSLECRENQLTSLDISQNKELLELSCTDNKLNQLDVSKVPALRDLVKNHQPDRDILDEDGWQVWQGYDPPMAQLWTDGNVKVITDSTVTVKISKAKVTAIRDQVYTGQSVRPAFTVKYDGKELTKGTDYTVTWKSNKQIGTAAVLITGKGAFKGTKEVTFRIIPKAVEISSVTAGKQQLTIQWKKGSNITGYQIEYSLKKDFSNSKKVTVSKTATKKILKNLKSGKKYYIRIRTYKTVDEKKYWSAWSAVKYKTTK